MTGIIGRPWSRSGIVVGNAADARSQLGLAIGTNVMAYAANNATSLSTNTFTNKTFDADGSGNSLNNVDLTADVTGTLPYGNGGVGQTSWAQGEILYASASNTLSKLTKGTDNHVLTMNGNVPNWEATQVAGGGAWTLLDSATASGSANVQLDQNIDTTYDVYLVEMSKVHSASDTVDGHILLESGGSYSTTSYHYCIEYQNSDASGFTSGSSTGDDNLWTSAFRDIGNGAGRVGNLELFLFAPADTSSYTTWLGRSICINATGNASFQVAGGAWDSSTAAVTGVQFKFNSGNVASGEFRLYGLALS